MTIDADCVQLGSINLWRFRATHTSAGPTNGRNPQQFVLLISAVVWIAPLGRRNVWLGNNKLGHVQMHSCIYFWSLFEILINIFLNINSVQFKHLFRVQFVNFTCYFSSSLSQLLKINVCSLLPYYYCLLSLAMFTSVLDMLMASFVSGKALMTTYFNSLSSQIKFTPESKVQ